MNALRQAIDRDQIRQIVSIIEINIKKAGFVSQNRLNLKRNRFSWKMDKNIQKELIIKTALEVLQNVLPTNIMENIEKLDGDDESKETSDDMDEERFIFEQLTRKVDQIEPVDEPNLEPIDPNASLTYFEIVEQEMMQSLPVSTENVTVCFYHISHNFFHESYKKCLFSLWFQILRYILSDFPEINSTVLADLKLQTLDQLTNILVYSLMTNQRSDETEQALFLESGTVNNVLETLCNIIADKKYAFIHWPNRVEMQQNVQLFESYHEFGYFEFYNVFGAIGTVEMQLKPALPNYLSVAESTGRNQTYTPVKWQCSCDTSGILQSSLVFVPKREIETKNSYVFEVNPVKLKLEAMKSDEMYLVADETLTIFPFLLTPHEKIIIRAEEHNKALESKRKVIDKTFEHIQGRFFILNRIELRNAKSVCNLIETVGILHNFFMVHHDLLYIDDYDAIL